MRLKITSLRLKIKNFLNNFREVSQKRKISVFLYCIFLIF
ncbi:hypothetical protein LEP1GSC008_2586 [Leptospira kirschneri serovar Bulgarica str. Nikolaevo]|uniref:Uncharacterized protein n=1 Tax=Leptospira kirschneri serovar Bulgarica str. Nikolaevo TaxID=1240687 RepID=M6EXG2_9LEPT|nr:hypothetical protein LEP1GSC008_2586 [Leptospira kirschneri serovar Bulgarica str. Nikolaevo]